jgi:hypothetical protein
MPNPSRPDRDDAPDAPAPDRDAETTHPTRREPAADAAAPAEQGAADHDERGTDSYSTVPGAAEAATEVFATETLATDGEPEPKTPQTPQQKPPERRFTAPGFDAGQTEVIQSVPAAPTEVFHTQKTRRGAPRKATPQLVPPRLARKLPASASRSWGWVMALILIILALAVIAVLGTVWLTRDSRSKASQEDRVRESIHDFDIAVQNGDLPALRNLTCGDMRDGYVNYDQRAWDDTYRRVAAAKRYPVVASIDQVVVNDGHAEANVTAFMAYAPQVRSIRSFDLQYRDGEWKICQSPTG